MEACVLTHGVVGVVAAVQALVAVLMILSICLVYDVPAMCCDLCA